MSKRKEKKIYTYQCMITGESYKTTREASNPSELISVEGYYELNPEKDDRPEHIRITKKEIAAAKKELNPTELKTDQNASGTTTSTTDKETATKENQ